MAIYSAVFYSYLSMGALLDNICLQKVFALDIFAILMTKIMFSQRQLTLLF